MCRFSSLASILVALLIVLAAAAQGGSPGFAQAATPGASSTVLPPDAEVGGVDLAEWSARSWQWSFSLPPASNPFVDETGDWCGYGQSGPVFFLAGAQGSVERTCVIPEGVHVFVPLLGSECSTVEPPPFFGRDEAELRRCAIEAVDTAEGAFDMGTMRLSVDGQDFTDLSAYRVTTPRFSLWLPDDNFLGATSRVADSVADGYQVMLSPLSEGEHEVVFSVPGPQITTVTYQLMVVSGGYVDAQDSPAVTPSASA
jgi:hypothetical protein